MSNVCGNDDVDERVGAEEWMDEDLEDPDDEYDEEREMQDHPERFDQDEAEHQAAYTAYLDGIIRPLKRRRYGFDVIVGICSRPIRTKIRDLGNGLVEISDPIHGHWRKHLYKKCGERLVCRRCGEVYAEIPF